MVRVPEPDVPENPGLYQSIGQVVAWWEEGDGKQQHGLLEAVNGAAWLDALADAWKTAMREPHMVEFTAPAPGRFPGRPIGWHIEHPIRCRMEDGGLAACPMIGQVDDWFREYGAGLIASGRFPAVRYIVGEGYPVTFSVAPEGA